MNPRLIALSLATLICTGCASAVKTTKETTPPNEKPEYRGTAYYLPQGKVIVSGTWNKEQKTWDLKATTLIEADPGSRFVLSRRRNALFDDDLTLGVDPTTGLLQTAHAITTDQTANIVGSIVSAVASGLTFGASLGPVTGFKAAVMDEPYGTVRSKAMFSSFQIVVNPGSKTAHGYVRSPDTDATQLFGKFAIKLTPLDYDPGQTAVSPASAKSDGVVVRRPIPWGVEISALVYNHDGSQNVKFEAPLQTVFLPDADHDFVVPIHRTPLVSNTTKLNLVNGMVQSHQEIRPSVVMGAFSVPKNILSALVPIPLQIRQAQQANVEAVQKRMAAQESIQEMKAP